MIKINENVRNAMKEVLNPEILPHALKALINMSEKEYTPEEAISKMAPSERSRKAMLKLLEQNKKTGRKCEDDVAGHEGCEEELYWYSESPQAGVSITYIVCPTHGNLDAVVDIDD